MANFSVGSSVKGVSAYINRLNKIADATKNSFDKNSNLIGERYRDIARENLRSVSHTQRYGDLLIPEIYYIKDKKGVSIVAGMMPEAIEQLYYAEFGAGMVSKNHPLANEYGWQYDMKAHGEKGWRFTPMESTKIKEISGEQAGAYYEIGEPFKYQRKNGKWVAWTRSSEPTLFMYNTYRRILTDGYIAKLIKDDIEKIKY